MMKRGLLFGLLIILMGLSSSGCTTSTSPDSEPGGATSFIVAPGQPVNSTEPASSDEGQLMPSATEAVAPQPPAATSSPGGGVSHIQIYLVALEDNGQNGPKIGCGDSLIPVEREITPTAGPLRAALEELLSLKEQYYGQSGLYNALYQSDLHLEKVTIDENGQAVIHLAGNYALGGVCDTPRFKAQLEATARQFSTVRDVVIFINNIPIDDALSLASRPVEVVS